MIFAAIADIHGNCAALEAVLEDIARLGIKDIVNLGDCFSGPWKRVLPVMCLLVTGYPAFAAIMTGN